MQRDRLADARSDGRFVGNVQREKIAFGAGRAEGGGECGPEFEAAVGDDYAVVRCCVEFGGGLADAACAPGLGGRKKSKGGVCQCWAWDHTARDSAHTIKTTMRYSSSVLSWADMMQMYCSGSIDAQTELQKDLIPITARRFSAHPACRTGYDAGGSAVRAPPGDRARATPCERDS